MQAVRIVVPAALASVVLLPLLGSAVEAVVDLEAHWRGAWKELAAPDDHGFVVWESNRTGDWRIWRRDLDGRGLRQLTPDEPEREHFAPHLSPDGSQLVYLSMPQGQDCYSSMDQAGVLRIIRTDGAEDRVLATTARPYFEDRAALWIDDDRLFHIDGEGTTRELTVSTGESVPRTREPAEFYGWLPNATETHATAGWPMFPPFDAEDGRILLRTRFGGCQPYFSRDGRWGFYTRGGGGPIDRFDLATRESTEILAKHDPRLPESHRYFYFPMLSACQNRFAFAASYYAHDHFGSDYDVFVAAIDPFTLELEGLPIRYTFDPGCDRFPDVHLTSLDLGRHRGTVPFRVDVSSALDASWEIDFGDGTPPQREPNHVYERPGSYWVVASRDDERRFGRVRVEPRGMAEEAPRAPTERWPIEPDGLAFAFELGDADNLAVEAESGDRISFEVSPRGAARYDRRFAMVLDGGRFESPTGATNIGAWCRESGRLAFEAVVEPRGREQRGKVVELAGPDGVSLFEIAQSDQLLIARFRSNARDTHVALGEATSSKHLAIEIGAGKLVARVDGETVTELDQFDVDPSRWQPESLRFGDGAWRGALHHVAVFAGERSDAQIARSKSLVEEWRARLPQVQRRHVRAKLVAKSDIPTLEQIKPYRSALVVFEYSAVEGALRVAHWVMLDGQTLPIARRAIGAECELVLEPLAAHPECEPHYLGDSLPEDFDLELFFDIR